MKSDTWPSHWLLGEDHSVFRNAVATIISEADIDLSRADARETIGGEDTQCQHFFTKAFSLMHENQAELTKALLCCSKIEDPVMEIRYYRSVPRRSRRQRNPQLVESETGADFAITLQANVPNKILADRSVFGQAKIIDNSGIQISGQQLDALLSFAGQESATYMMWGHEHSPTMITAQNIKTLGRIREKNRLSVDVLRYGKPFAEFLIESLIGLWFGKDFDRALIRQKIPKDSPPALFMALHVGAPPPNVLHLGVSSSNSRNLRPGVYISEVINMEEHEDQNEDRR